MNLKLPARCQAWADAALSFIYPEVCQICGTQRASHAQSYVCDGCRADVKLIEPPFCGRCGRPYPGDITVDFVCNNCGDLELNFCWARSAALVEGPLLEAIHQYKYLRHRWFETFLGELLVHAAAKPLQAEPWDGLVPVPLFPVKEREREFNQAERLARHLSAATGIPLEGHVLRRIRPTPSQTRLTRTERAENMRRAFALHKDAQVTGKHYVLIDDVFTTGATTSACAKVLLKGGAARVAVWTVARPQ